MTVTQATMFQTSTKRPTGKTTVIYETRGKAQEYRRLACNLYSGCEHGCTYCYAPAILRRSRGVFAQAKPRTDILHKLKHDAMILQDQGVHDQIMLCFTCDPYQPVDDELGITRWAIDILHAHDLSVCILTKGGHRALRDMDLFQTHDSFATTLTFLDDAQSLEWEPGAALPAERIKTLKAFHEAGIHTWVSLEPVIDPAATLESIRQTHRFVDEFKVGKLNHHPLAKTIDWRQFAQDAIVLLATLGKPYYIKKDLAAYLE